MAEVLKPHLHKAILVAGHGPFAFGESAKLAVDHAQILEKVAMMALLGKYDAPLQDAILKYRHFHRKHGSGDHKYYGQA
jgi:L-ribulose-5-phosphate 4-epimerase